MERPLQALFEGADEKPAHEARIAKADLGFRRMHIDIDLARAAFDKESERGVPTMRQIVHIGRANGTRQKLVADRTTVDKEILR